MIRCDKIGPLCVVGTVLWFGQLTQPSLCRRSHDRCAECQK